MEKKRKKKASAKREPEKKKNSSRAFNFCVHSLIFFFPITVSESLEQARLTKWIK